MRSRYGNVHKFYAAARHFDKFIFGNYAAAETHLKRKSRKNVFPPVKAPHLRRYLFFIESYFFVRNTFRPLSERKFFKRKQITPVIKK